MVMIYLYHTSNRNEILEKYMGIDAIASLGYGFKIVLSHPDEIFQEDDGSIRLWWD